MKIDSCYHQFKKQKDYSQVVDSDDDDIEDILEDFLRDHDMDKYIDENKDKREIQFDLISEEEKKEALEIDYKNRGLFKNKTKANKKCYRY